MQRVRAIAVATALLGACTAPAPAAVAPSPSAASSTVPIASAAADWSVLPVTELQRLTIGCLNGVEMSEDRAVIRNAGDGFVGGPSRLRPWIEAHGDFGVAATIGSDSDGAADLVLYGALPKGEYWQGVKRLDVGLRNGRLAISALTGETRDPAIQRSLPTPGVSRSGRVGVRKVGSDLVFRVNNAEVGRVADPGLFGAGVVDLGVNVAPHTTMTIADLAVEVPPNGAGTLSVVPGFLDAPPPGPSLRSLAAARSVRIGAHNDGPGTDPTTSGFLADPASRRTLAREYDHLTVGVWLSTAPSPDRFDFCEPDALVAFGRAHGMEMRVQTLIYGTPKWLTDGAFSREQLLDWMHRYISTVMARYRGQVRSWEVANELFAFIPTDCSWNTKDGNSAAWVRMLGPTWVDQAFRWAHEAEPQAKLYYNENRAEGLGLKSDCVYAMVKGMKERGVPIDGVGMQSHFIIPEAKAEPWNVPPTAASVAANMKRYGDLGLLVQVTEIDVKVGKNAGPTELAAQARVYADMLRTCLAATNCAAFTSWGVSDRYSWIRLASNPFRSPGEQPLPFDESFQPKPAYAAMLEVLKK
jgi:endo-1,4-beta-xylanase